MSARTLTIALTPRLAGALRILIRNHRRLPKHGNVSTPENVAMALRHEQRLENATLRDLVKVLLDNAPETVDLRITDGMERLKAAVIENAQRSTPNAQRSIVPAKTLPGLLADSNLNSQPS